MATTTPLQAAISKVYEIAKRFRFDPEGEYRDGDSTLCFSTRAHGDVGEETPGDEDIQAAKVLKAAIREEFPIPVTLDTCDEWVEVSVDVGDLQAHLNTHPAPTPASPKMR